MSNIILGLSMILLTISCNKQATNIQSDDININTPIVYSGGWGGSGISISMSSEIINENQDNPSYTVSIKSL